jgi:CDP-glycerol glycerophosphotransferase (TagB/SpsB family)
VAAGAEQEQRREHHRGQARGGQYAPSIPLPPAPSIVRHLQDYRDNLRGFNLDFEAEVPGPLLATSAEVVSALGDLDAVVARYRAKYEAFVTKFCPLDDGKAGARACDRIFGS